MNLPAKLGKTDPAALLAYADAAYEQLRTNYVKFVEVLYLIYEQQAYKPLYESWQEYVEKRFARRIRSAQDYLRLGRAYKRFPDLKRLDITKAKLLLPHVNEENVNERVDEAEPMTVSELKERYPAKTQTIFSIHVSFCDPEDARTVQEAINLGKKVVGSDRLQPVIVAMAQAAMQDFVQQADDHADLDPVTRATFERDGWTCQGCGARQHLHRHSHLKAHLCAEVTDCVTLCYKCHAAYHAEKASIEWLGPGKIRFIKKGETSETPR